ncbi:X-ray repair cross-complementing protein 6 [Microplitis demolitor]|uniref:X-ray repair cross-complementing protein 6 n=1 Tax=Microplitis demolitor TaxID=69319 RepID=UPI0004CD4FF9|nr:X-ray repair cross-complementing protein 6 [Microplitis demolitor]
MTSLSQVKSQIKLPEPRYYGNEPVQYGFRIGNLFIIDLTDKMFIKDELGITPFHQCLDAYMKVMRKKLSANAEDWMGLMFCRANKELVEDEYPADDENETEPRNVLSVQKFKMIERDMYMDVAKMRDKDIDYYKKLCSSDNNSISDVLLHATRTYNAVKKVMAGRKVIFMTCDDNPALANPEERNRIRINAKSFKDLAIKLQVVGLGDDWNYELFWKEIEEISDNLAARNFRRVGLGELEEDIVHKSFVVGHLDFRVQPNLKIRVSVQAFSKTRKVLRKITASKATNEPLDKYSWWSFDENVFDELEDNDDASRLQDPNDLKRSQRYGLKDILFTPEEVRRLHHVHDQGIDLLGFKPMLNREPMDQINHPYFLGCHSAASKGQIELFAVLLAKMNEKNLMAVCSITIKKTGAPRLAYLIPYVQYGGFYLFRIPFKHEVRTLDDITNKYIFDEDENPAPINEEKLTLIKNLVKKLSVKYDVTMFENPKLQRQLTYVENLALELPPREPPADTTLPSVEDITDRLSQGNLFDRLKSTIDNTAHLIPTSKVVKADMEYVREVLEEENFSKLTVDKLKAILKALDLSITGKKQDLINRLLEYKATH